MPTLSILYKKYDEAAINALPYHGFNFVPVSGHAMKVYLILLLSAVLATGGAAVETFYPLGTKVWVLNFAVCIWWLFYLDHENLISMVFAFGAGSVFLGGASASLTDHIPFCNERDILILFGGAAIMFCFNACALRTRNVASFFKVHYFNVPVSIAFMVAMSYVLKNVSYPTLLYFIPGFVLGIPAVWFSGYLFFRNQLWVPGRWIPIHCHFLSIIYILTKYDVLVLLGIYLVMFCCVLNSKMHTYDVIFTIDALAGNDFHPIPLVLAYYYEFFGRASYLAISSGSYLCRQFWESNEVYLMAKWQYMCSVAVRFRVYLQGKFVSFRVYLQEKFVTAQNQIYDFVMSWLVIAWCTLSPYVSEFKGYLFEFKDYFTRILLISVVFIFLCINLFLFVSSRVQAN